MSKFERINFKKSKLVQNLKDKEWWHKLVELSQADKDFNIQIRDTYINIYYKMGNFLKIKNQSPVAEMHYKYVPIISDSTSVRINFDLENGSIVSDIKTMDNNILDDENLKKIKSLISLYAGEEKSYQSKLIEANSENILDAEIALTSYGRIDLMLYNHKENKIIAVEFKIINNPELFNGDIKDQLRRYSDFMSDNKSEILEAYKNSIKTKIELGLLRESDILAQIDFTTVEIETKPILAITAYTQELINKFQDTIKNEVGDIAYAQFMFGGTGDLMNYTGNNYKF